MKTVPDEYPAHETLWRFAIIWTIVACIAAPLIIGYILKKTVRSQSNTRIQ